MNYESLSKDILQLVGGTTNITWAGHCATRLRINVKNISKVNKEHLQQLTGVIGVMQSGKQMQIVIGPDVANLFMAFSKLGNFEDNKQGDDGEKKNIAVRIVDAIAGVFTPILPALCGAGMLKAILVLLTTFSIITEDSSTYQFFSIFSDSLFYFLPMFLAYTAAKKFNCNPFVAVSVAGIMLHPTFTAMVAAGEPVDFFGIQVPLITYSSSVIPIILTVWFMGYVERGISRITPNALKFFTVPVLTILIAAPVGLLIFGPLGDVLGGWLSSAISFMDSRASWLVLTLMGAFSPLIVMSGMVYSLFPIIFQGLAQSGYTTLLSVSALPSNLAQGGACMAVALRTKDKELRSVAISSGITAMMGITEPALYGVTLRLKKPLLAVFIAGGVGALYGALVFLRSFGMVSPGLAAFAVFIDPSGSPMNLINFFIVCLIGFGVSFVLTLILGFDDPGKISMEPKEQISSSKDKLIHSIEIFSPVTGSIIPLQEVNDKVFNSGIMGKGIAISSDDQLIYAPVNGEITALFPSKHAIGIRSDEGCELLVHIGLNTNELHGTYFTNDVVLHQHVKVGDAIASVNMKACKEAGYDMSICLVVTNSKEYFDVVDTQQKTIKVLEKVMEVL